MLIRKKKRRNIKNNVHIHFTDTDNYKKIAIYRSYTMLLTNPKFLGNR